ncbi:MULTISPECIES: hypothetical protein [unclassified Bradyrhizobium]|uniref:hypothetical protein n=1 Tax=unclassified Bradyrhizobium TaxID=2631580 RepID=UPI002915EBA7|nr:MULTISPECIES: hypothetical protein [unclassified Bradyrhizobium]
MRKIEEFVDERQKSWCIHCARSLASRETNEDHVPSKSFLVKPRPHNLPVVTICKECNTSFSLDEQYATTFLSCVLAGGADPAQQPNASARRALIDSSALRARLERSRTEYMTRSGEKRIMWKPELERIQRVVLKNARGHAYFEYGEPMLKAPAHIWVLPLESMTAVERRSFNGLIDGGSFAFLPEVGSGMMTRMVSGEDMAGHWVTVQDGIYRYSVRQVGGLRVRSILSEFLATEVQWEH